MDIQQYIASGILEQYVLGNLSAAESREVERHAGLYPEIKAEIAAIEQALEQYAKANAVQPSAGLESRILEKINQKTPAGNKPGKPGSKLGFLSYTLLYRLAIVALLAALVWGISLHNKLKEANAGLAVLQTRYEELNTRCSEQLKQKERTEQLFAFLKDLGTRPVEMKGIPAKAPDALAIVFHNTNLQKSYLEVVNMPAVPSGKQYQLWAIVAGKPVDMGVFDATIVPGSPFLEIPFVTNAQAFAVTIEQAGGSPVPTLEEMVVIGNAG